MTNSSSPSTPKPPSAQPLPDQSEPFPIWFDRASKKGLVWLDSVGIGLCREVDREMYGPGYWNEYRRRDNSDMGRKLTHARVDFVREFIDHNDIIDVGIGGGRFVEAMNCCGCDVNPDAVRWLKLQGRWRDAEMEACSAQTYWDSIEHIMRPNKLLRNAGQHVFLSTPIYRDHEHVLKSRHYKPAEHVLYFTREGLCHYMSWFGFECIGYDDVETRLGRDQIGSFAFKRVV